jgi:ATP-dependent exoDNAse (exonuclease V) beta subunit
LGGTSLNNIKGRVCKDVEINEVLSYVRWVIGKRFRYKNIIAEDILYSDKYKIAGQCDLIVFHNNGTFDLWDWKTNTKELSYIGYNRMKYPFLFLSDGELQKYEFQLSIYAYFAEQRYGLKAGKLTIGHMRDGKIVPIRVNYRKDLIKLLFEDYENKKVA